MVLVRLNVCTYVVHFVFAKCPRSMRTVHTGAIVSMYIFLTYLSGREHVSTVFSFVYTAAFPFLSLVETACLKYKMLLLGSLKSYTKTKNSVLKMNKIKYKRI